MEGNWGSLSNIEILKARGIRAEYQELDRQCIEAILKAAGLIPTGEINSSEAGLFSSEESDSNEVNLPELLGSAHSYIIQLKSLLDHLEHDFQNSPETLVMWEGQIKFYLIWVNELGVQHEELLKRNLPMTPSN